ncbi:hypothetical protein [Phaeodactylibacter xiamenensis]|uniref:hypothetical protein n=1 Tax=Phaeodactylibacter xiamenensis TaxID=1524460 RepID=UPI003CCBF78E
MSSTGGRLDKFRQYIEDRAQQEFKSFLERYQRSMFKAEAVEQERGRITRILEDESFTISEEIDPNAKGGFILYRSLPIVDRARFIEKRPLLFSKGEYHSQLERNLIAVYHRRYNIEGQPYGPELPEEAPEDSAKVVIPMLFPNVFLRFLELLNSLAGEGQQDKRKGKADRLPGFEDLFFIESESKRVRQLMPENIEYFWAICFAMADVITDRDKSICKPGYSSDVVAKVLALEFYGGEATKSFRPDRYRVTAKYEDSRKEFYMKI